MKNESSPVWVDDNFAVLQTDLQHDPADSFDASRQQALDRFQHIGLPDRRQEAWRFTDLNALKKQSFRLAPAVQADESVRRAVQTEQFKPSLPLVVFLNGRFCAELSHLDDLPAGLHVHNLQSGQLPDRLGELLPAEMPPFVALNSAFLRDGVAVSVDDHSVIEEPLQLLFLTDARKESVVTHPRLWMHFGCQSQVTVLESYATIGKAEAVFSNPVIEIHCEAEAMVDHIRLLRESSKAFHVASQFSRQTANSHLASFSLVLGGGLVRNDVHARLDGQGGTTVLDGLYIASGTQVIDHHTYMDHAQPNGNSRQLYKGILDEHSRAVFNGKIHVHRPAQKTDAIQNNKNLLLSDTASVDTQPMLEIFADDVRCTHGGTVGQLDLDGIFYLRSRGIGLEMAKKMMIHSFASDALQRIRNRELCEWLDGRVVEKLETLPSIR